MGGGSLRHVRAETVTNPAARTGVAPSRLIVDPRSSALAGVNASSPLGLLTSVSCTSATACTAVGYHHTHLTLAERWNGKKWTIQPTPNPANDSYLTDVSCTSPTACTAVGYYGGGNEGVDCQAGDAQCWGVAESWDGKRWAIQPTPIPAGAKGVYLLGVSCTSSKACTAVGYVGLSWHYGRPLAERWNGKMWAIQAAPGGENSHLTDVSCSSAKTCIAVGDYYDPTAGTLTLAERWNGKKWAVQPTPNLAESSDRRLTGPHARP